MKKIVFIILISYHQILSAQFNIGLSMITVDAQTLATVTGLCITEPGFALPPIQVRGGSFNISVKGIIDRQATPQITFSMMAEEMIGDELMIFVLQDSNFVRYKVEGIGMGNHTGPYKDGWFHVSLRFKITADAHPSYLLDPPVHVYISPEGKMSNDNTFIGGVGYISGSNKEKKKEKNKKSNEIIVRE